MISLALAKRWAGPLLIVAAIGAGYAYHRVQLSKAHTAGYRAAEAAMAARVADANANTAALEQRQREQTDRAAVAWETKRNELEAQVAGMLARPRPAVRLCHDSAGGGQVPLAAVAAGRAHDSAGGQVDAVRMGDDFGRTFIVRAGACERYRLQLIELQSWIRSVTPPPPP